MGIVTALRSRLSEQGRDLLDAKTAKANTWSTFSAIAMYALAAGFNETEFELLCRDSVAITMTSRDADELLSKVYSSAESHYKPTGDISTVRRQLAELHERIEARPWVGRNGSTDRAVALALVSRAHEIGAYTPGISVRTLAERAGMNHPAVRKSLRRLMRLGLMTRLRGRRAAEAARYRIDLSWGECVNDPIRLYRENLIGSLSHSAYHHPAFLRGAIGATAGRVFFGMVDGSTPSEISDQVGISPDSAKYNLRKLLTYNLVVKDSGRYTVRPGITEDDLDAIAEERGTSDWSERIKRRHAAERQAMVVSLAERDERTAPVSVILKPDPVPLTYTDPFTQEPGVHIFDKQCFWYDPFDPLASPGVWGVWKYPPDYEWLFTTLDDMPQRNRRKIDYILSSQNISITSDPVPDQAKNLI